MTRKEQVAEAVACFDSECGSEEAKVLVELGRDYLAGKIGEYEEITPEQLHEWYLEAVEHLHPEHYNLKAKKQYADLTEEQQYIDQYIADKINKTPRQEYERCKIPNCECGGDAIIPRRGVEDKE